MFSKNRDRFLNSEVAQHFFAEVNLCAKALLQRFGVRVKMGKTRAEPAMSDFKWRHFEGEIILWAVRWYCRYGISYRDLEQMMGERDVTVDHST